MGSEIGPGNEWRGVVDDHLNTAEIILLLVSPSFLTSNYRYDVEVRQVMERHETDGCKVIPVILRPCVWNIAPFGQPASLARGGQGHNYVAARGILDTKAWSGVFRNSRFK